MCAKKKAAFSKAWKLAGEPIYSSPLTAVERESIAEDFFIYKKFRGGETRGLRCVTPAMARIHESAVQVVAGFLCQHYAGRFERKAVIKVVSTTAAIPGDMTNRVVGHLDFLMGAALWLLDYLEDACKDPDEYLDLLPEANEVLDLYMPCAEDLIHSQETILRMVTVLEGREKAYRKEFRSLLSLIDDETAAKLRGAFKAALLDYLDRAIEIYNRLKPVTPELPPVMEDFTQPFDPLQKVDHKTENPEIYFLMLALELVCRPQFDIQKELHSRKSAELLAGYGVDDPHELCAAYLLLERERDALANLNALTAVVLNCAARHLPWAQDDFGARAGLFQSGAPDYRLRYEYNELPDEDGEEPLEMDWRLSETQLFFLATGVILPRGRAPSDKLVRWFVRQGVEEQRARELAWAAFMAYYIDNGDYRWKNLDLFDDEADEDLPEDGPAEPCEEPVPPLAEAAMNIQAEALTRQVKELRSALHDAERTSNRLREQLRELEQRGGGGPLRIDPAPGHALSAEGRGGRF